MWNDDGIPGFPYFGPDGVRDITRAVLRPQQRRRDLDGDVSVARIHRLGVLCQLQPRLDLDQVPLIPHNRRGTLLPPQQRQANLRRTVLQADQRQRSVQRRLPRRLGAALPETRMCWIAEQV